MADISIPHLTDSQTAGLGIKGFDARRACVVSPSIVYARSSADRSPNLMKFLPARHTARTSTCQISWFSGWYHPDPGRSVCWEGRFGLWHGRVQFRSRLPSSRGCYQCLYQNQRVLRCGSHQRTVR